MDAAGIRRVNRSALASARRAEVTNPELVRAAELLGDQVLAQECRVCLAVAFVSAGRTSESNEVLGEAAAAATGGVQVSNRWQWHLEQANAQVALDLGDYERSWVHHRQALEVAERMLDASYIAESRTRLAHLAIRVGMFGDALVELSEVVLGSGVGTNTLVGAHLLLTAIHSENGEVERADHHSEIALKLVHSLSDFYVSRTMIAVASLTLDGDSSQWATSNLEYLREFASAVRSHHVQLEFDLLLAKLTHRLGDTADARRQLERIADRAPEDLSVRAEALVALTAVLVEEGEYLRALDTSSRALWVAAPPASEVRLLELRAEAFENLGRWQESSVCYQAAAKATAAQSFDVLTIYKLHHAELMSEALEVENHELEQRNAELAALSHDHEAMMNAIGNTLQSPLTALQLNLELLSSDLVESKVQVRTVAAKRVVARLGRVANQLTLAGELEAGSIIPDGRWVSTSELFSSLANAATQATDSRRMTLRISEDPQRIEEQVHVDLERSTQLVGAIFDGIAEYSAADSVVDLRFGTADATHMAVEVLVPMLQLDPDRFEAMRNRQAWETLGILDPDTSPDLSFYVAARLCAILGCDLHVHARGTWGTEFELLLPGARRAVGAIDGSEPR